MGQEADDSQAASRRRVAGTTTDVDILVVGSGPVGLAAALHLDSLGYDVAVVAPAARPDDHRTAALLAGSVSFLEELGVWPIVADQSAPLRSLRIVDATRRLIRAPEVLFHASEIGLDAFGYNIANAVLTGGLDRLNADRGITRIAASVEKVAVDDNIQQRHDLAHGRKLGLGRLLPPLRRGRAGRTSRASAPRARSRARRSSRRG